MSKEVVFTIKAVKQETAESVSLSFESSDTISYKAGQYITFIQSIQGEEIRRCYSLSSSPNGADLPTITLKRVKGGKMSNWLADNAKPGMQISGYLPMGNFVMPEFKSSEVAVYIGGGSGVTPLISMIREGFSKGLKQYLLLVNRNADAAIFKNELDQYAISRNDFKMAHHFTEMLGKPTVKDIVNWIKTLGLQSSSIKVFICGPEGLMANALEASKSFGIASDSIYKESFVTSTSKEATTDTISSEEKDYEVTIQFQKKSYSIIVPKGQTILETALSNKIRLPHSCQSGLCTACMGQCLQGKVEMMDPEGLSENEIKKGFVLTCVGKPASEGVIIKID